MVKTWSELYKTVNRLASMVTNAEANVVCEEVCSKLLEGYRDLQIVVSYKLLEGYRGHQIVVSSKLLEGYRGHQIVASFKLLEEYRATRSWYVPSC